MKTAGNKISFLTKRARLPQLAAAALLAASLPGSLRAAWNDLGAFPAPSVPAVPQPAAGQPDTAAAKLVEGVLFMIAHPETTPQYLGGYHPDWHDNNDHCYSIYFRIAIEQGLLSESRGEAIMKSIKPLDGESFREAMFPLGFRRLTYKAAGGSVVFPPDPVPAGWLISMDGSDHNMLSTGRVLPDGRHEVFSFKGGGPETPVWGDSVGYDPNARIHVMTLEQEFENLAADDQPIDDIFVAAGRPAILPAGK